VVQPQAMGEKSGKESRRLRRQRFDHLHQLHEYSRESLGFLVNEAILTHTHWSIQSVHDRCIALAECVQTPSPTTGASELYPNH
jgi:hypothetical protein